MKFWIKVRSIMQRRNILSLKTNKYLQNPKSINKTPTNKGLKSYLMQISKLRRSRRIHKGLNLYLIQGQICNQLSTLKIMGKSIVIIKMDKEMGLVQDLSQIMMLKATMILKLTKFQTCIKLLNLQIIPNSEIALRPVQVILTRMSCPKSYRSQIAKLAQIRAKTNNRTETHHKGNHRLIIQSTATHRMTKS